MTAPARHVAASGASSGGSSPPTAPSVALRSYGCCPQDPTRPALRGSSGRALHEVSVRCPAIGCPDSTRRPDCGRDRRRVVADARQDPRYRVSLVRHRRTASRGTFSSRHSRRGHGHRCGGSCGDGHWGFCFSHRPHLAGRPARRAQERCGCGGGGRHERDEPPAHLRSGHERGRSAGCARSRGEEIRRTEPRSPAAGPSRSSQGYARGDGHTPPQPGHCGRDRDRRPRRHAVLPASAAPRQLCGARKGRHPFRGRNLGASNRGRSRHRREQFHDHRVRGQDAHGGCQGRGQGARQHPRSQRAQPRRDRRRALARVCAPRG